MKAFTYERVNTPAEAALSAQRVPGAKFIAGGTNLLDLMKLEIETPTHLIDVNGLGLDKIEVTDAGGLRIGALVRNTDLAAHERVRRDYAVLSRALLAGASGQAGCGSPRRFQFPGFCGFWWTMGREYLHLRRLRRLCEASRNDCLGSRV